MVENNKIYDLIIIGGGVSGFGAALYAGRFKLNTLVISKDTGGTINTASLVENYPGIPEIQGIDLGDKIKDHAMKYDIKFKFDNVSNIEKKDDLFYIEGTKESFTASSIIIATGSEYKKLGIPGEKEFTGNGVHNCAMCDGYIYKDKTVAVVGGSDTACKDALILAETAKKVYIIYRKETPRCEPILLDKINQSDKIEIISNTNVIEIVGDDNKVSKIILDKEYNGSNDFELDGVFIAIGSTPLSQIAAKIGVETTDRNEIVIDKESKTCVPGVFAAGDVTDTLFKQVVTGVAQGVFATYSAFMYLKKKK